MQSAMLLELLAARQGGSMNPALQDMLARLRAGGGTSGGRTVQDLLAQVSQSNPALSSILQQMNASPESQGAVIDAETIEVDTTARRSARQDYYRDAETSVDTEASAIPMLEEIRAQADAAAAELAVYRERLDRCAAALGACGLCWGCDPSCRACRGRGRPGFALPDDMLFEEMIVPVIRLVRANRAKPVVSSRSPSTQINAST